MKLVMASRPVKAMTFIPERPALLSGFQSRDGARLEIVSHRATCDVLHVETAR